MESLVQFNLSLYDGMKQNKSNKNTKAKFLCKQIQLALEAVWFEDYNFTV
jgi:hypothetical protein